VSFLKHELETDVKIYESKFFRNVAGSNGHPFLLKKERSALTPKKNGFENPACGIDTWTQIRKGFGFFRVFVFCRFSKHSLSSE